MKKMDTNMVGKKVKSFDKEDAINILKMAKQLEDAVDAAAKKEASTPKKVKVPMTAPIAEAEYTDAPSYLRALSDHKHSQANVLSSCADFLDTEKRLNDINAILDKINSRLPEDLGEDGDDDDDEYIEVDLSDFDDDELEVFFELADADEDDDEYSKYYDDEDDDYDDCDGDCARCNHAMHIFYGSLK